MSQQPDQEGSPEFAEVNENLTRALRLCHSLVDDYRLKLAANSNEADASHDQRGAETDLG